MPENSALFEDERAGRIYRTAARLIFEKGFDATSMSEIADAVDLTKAGLYYYVKGKKELLFAIMSFAMDLLEREVVAPAVAKSHPEERLREMISRHARLLAHDVGALGILMDEVEALSNEHRRLITARKRRYFDLLRETLDVMKASGELYDDVDTTVAAFSLLGMVMWISRWYSTAGELGAERVATDIEAMALRGLVRRPRPKLHPPLPTQESKGEHR